MKERILDIIKWGVIIVIGALAFYLVYPKYYFSSDPSGTIHNRGNKFTGKVEEFKYDYGKGKWIDISKKERDKDEALKQLAIEFQKEERKAAREEEIIQSAKKKKERGEKLSEIEEWVLTRSAFRRSESTK